MRQLTKMLKEICAENGNRLEALFSGDWIAEIKGGTGDKSFFVVGYKFPNNNVGAAALCDDKSGLSVVLAAHGFKCVPHHYMLSSDSPYFVGNRKKSDNLPFDLLEKHKKLVLKPNSGTGGDFCYAAMSHQEVAEATKILFSKTDMIAISPFLDIVEEYRVIVLNGVAELVYSKERAFVMGDGVSETHTLVAEKFKGGGVEVDGAVRLDRVLEKGERQLLNWKHNIGKGARCCVLSPSTIYDELTTLALKVSKSVGINFASVDIVAVGGELMILEINSGVMMEGFSTQSEQNYQAAKKIYEKAILSF